MTKKLFSELNLSPELLKAIDHLGFEQAAPIQAEAIPILMQGRDVVGQSQTGSGKTAAFAIPAVEKTDPQKREVQVLILCPTRELAVQVSEEVHKLASFKRGIHALPIYGGQSYERQFYGLRQGAQIVIGTPGRVMDHMRRGTLRLDSVKMAVLDEADVMLDMGFREDIELILKSVPVERQIVFFSATMPRPIRDLIDTFARDPATVRIEQKALTVPTVDQVYYEVDRRFKIELLTRLIDIHDYKLGIIFCNTKRMVDDLVDHLNAQGYSADRLHGDMSQHMRDRVMNKFRKSGLDFLVATDVAARGIDVDEVQVVFNYDLPYDGEDYVHRIGRTGRAGRSGRAVSFVSGRELFQIQQIERYTKTRIQRARIPTADEVEQARATAFLGRIRATLQSGDYKRHDHLVENLLEEGFSSTDIVSALIHQLEIADGAGRDGTSRRDEAPPTRGGGWDRREQPEREHRSRDVRRAQPAAGHQRFAIARDQRAESAPRTAKKDSPVAVLPEAKPPTPPDPQAVSSVSPPPPALAVAPKRAEPPRAAEAPPTPRPPKPAPAPFPAKRAPWQQPPRGHAAAAPFKTSAAPRKAGHRTPAGRTRLYINVGSEMNVVPRDVVAAIMGETGLPPEVVGQVDIRERHLFADVASEHASAIISKLNRTRIKEHRVKVKIA